MIVQERYKRIFKYIDMFNINILNWFRLFGEMRDPGLFILSLEEIFSILYSSPDRENSTIKMSMYYNQENHFFDLLINHKFPHKLYEKENGEVFPLGISEVIVTSLRTSLKILK